LLSDLYARGDGVPHSCEQARLLLIAAAKKGSSAAAQKLRSVERNCR
jgi:TPR repeat protein